MDVIISYAPELILLAFLAITFLQSGLDKVLDWKGNASWLKDHFSKSPLAGSVPLLLGIITTVELAAGALSLAGGVVLMGSGDKSLGIYACLTAALALLMLFFGQRMARDYEGARTLVVYLIPTVFLLVLLQA